MANKQNIRLIESDLNRIIKESVNKVLKENLKNNFTQKYEYLTDLLDMYENMVSDGNSLSNEQLSQIEEIYDFLLQTNSNDNAFQNEWIEVAERLLGKFKRVKNHKSKIDESILTEGRLSKQIMFYESALLVASLALNYNEPKINEMLRRELSKMFDDVRDIEIYFTSKYISSSDCNFSAVVI